MELYMENFYPGKIMIMGQWVSSVILQYIRIQIRDLSNGISTLITNKQALYKIPEIEVVYHTPGVSDTEPQRLNLNRQGR